jgi:hypothetical protein
MKISQTLQIVATLILGLGPVSGHAQTYYYSGPVSGFTEVDLTPGAGSIGGFRTYFGTLTETLYYDPVTLTIREVGSVTVSPFSGSFDIVGTDPPFSGPHGEGVVLGSATLTVGNSGSFSFDRTGGLFPNGASDLLVPVSGFGIYQGQEFSGSWNIDLYRLATSIDAISPTSLTFSEFNEWNGRGGAVVMPGIGRGGLIDGTSDGVYYYSWQLNSAVATVPEPNSLSLLVLGLSALAFLRRR